MDSSDYYLYEDDRAYVNPTVSRDEQLGFVDTLRDTMGTENQRIATQTQQLGTNVPSSLGGLTGSGGYFQQRYQTPQMETTVNQLKATTQAKALNDLMSNYETQAKNRYSQAYRDYNRRKNSTSGGSGDGTDEGEVEYEDITTETEDTTTVTPPNSEDYYITGEEQTQRIVDRTGLPDWLVNVLKIFGSTS